MVDKAAILRVVEADNPRRVVAPGMGLRRAYVARALHRAPHWEDNPVVDAASAASFRVAVVAGNPDWTIADTRALHPVLPPGSPAVVAADNPVVVPYAADAPDLDPAIADTWPHWGVAVAAAAPWHWGARPLTFAVPSTDSSEALTAVKSNNIDESLCLMSKR